MKIFQKPNKKITLITLSIITIIALSVIIADLYSDYQTDQRIKQKHVEIATYIALPEEASFHEKTDHIREFIAAHSEINVNDEFYSIWRDYDKVLDTFLAGIKKERKSFVPVECSVRTTIIQDMYKHYGFDVRSIIVYDITTPSMISHVAMDVFNPETRKWETHDGLVNIYWRHKHTQQRATFMDMIGNEEDHEPCNSQRCGWDIISPEGEKAADTKRYFYIASAVDKKRNIRQSVYDSDKMSADTQITLNGKTGTFCQLIEKNCRNGFTPSK